jgi:hypothetical protein
MNALFWLGAVCAGYGLAGLAGFQCIGEEYRNRAWTREFCRDRGLSWLLLGVPWALLGLALQWWDFSWPIAAAGMAVLGIPAIHHTMRVDKKYDGKLAKEEDL